jgi:hypothetical protein
MAANTIPLIVKDLVITLRDGTPVTPLDLAIGVRKAGVAISDHGGYGNQEALPIYDQAGNLIGLRSKVRPYLCKVAWSHYMLQIMHGSTEVIEDWINKRATSPFSARVNTNSKGERDTMTLGMVWTDVQATPCTHTRAMTEFAVDSYGINESDDGATYDVSGTVYGTDTRTTTA